MKRRELAICADNISAACLGPRTDDFGRLNYGRPLLLQVTGKLNNNTDSNEPRRRQQASLLLVQCIHCEINNQQASQWLCLRAGTRNIDLATADKTCCCQQQRQQKWLKWAESWIISEITWFMISLMMSHDGVRERAVTRRPQVDALCQIHVWIMHAWIWKTTDDCELHLN